MHNGLHSKDRGTLAYVIAIKIAKDALSLMFKFLSGS